MTPLPQNIFDSGQCVQPDEAAAFDRPQGQDAAAEYDALMCDIHEIWAGARKLFDPDPAAYTNQDEVYYDILRARDDPHTADLIDVPYGFEAEFDPPPLFLQIAV
jgi:hypothetical protein